MIDSKTEYGVQIEALKKELALTKLELIHYKQTVRSQQFCVNFIHGELWKLQKARAEEFVSEYDELSIAE